MPNSKQFLEDTCVNFHLVIQSAKSIMMMCPIQFFFLMCLFVSFWGLIVKSSKLITCVFSLALENLVGIFVHASLRILLFLLRSLYNFCKIHSLKFSLSSFSCVQHVHAKLTSSLIKYRFPSSSPLTLTLH